LLEDLLNSFQSSSVFLSENKLTQFLGLRTLSWLRISPKDEPIILSLRNAYLQRLA